MVSFGYGRHPDVTNLKNNVISLGAKGVLRTFARKFSNIDFFLRILPLKVDELVMSEM